MTASIPLPLADVPGWQGYSALDEPAWTPSAMPSWPRLHERYPRVLAFSRLGHVVVSSRRVDDFAVVYPLEGGMKGYQFPDWDTFRAGVLDDPGFQHWIMPEPLVRPVVSRLGVVGDETIYLPVPYPAIGGSGAPETYSTGGVWAFLDLTGQLWL